MSKPNPAMLTRVEDPQYAVPEWVRAGAVVAALGWNRATIVTIERVMPTQILCSDGARYTRRYGRLSRIGRQYYGYALRSLDDPDVQRVRAVAVAEQLTADIGRMRLRIDSASVDGALKLLTEIRAMVASAGREIAAVRLGLRGAS